MGLDHMDFNGRRELLRLLVEEVIYDKGLLTIKTVLPLEQLHPVSGRVREGALPPAILRTGQSDRGPRAWILPDSPPDASANVVEKPWPTLVP